MSTKPRGNLIALGLGQLARLGAGLAVNVLLMRWLGVEGYGVYGYVLTLTGLLSFGASLGMGRYINRELSRAPERTGELVATGLATTAVLAVFTTLAIVGVAALLDGRTVVLVAATLGGIGQALQAFAEVPQAAIHAARRMAVSTRAQVAGRLTLVTITAIGLFSDLGVVAVFVGQVGDGLVTCTLMLRQLRHHLHAERLQTSPAQMRQLVHSALPFGLNLFFGSIYLSADVLLLEWMKGDEEVGIYRGAVMLIALFPVLANTLTTGIYPRMARHLGNREAAGAELGFATRVLLAVSVPAAVGGMWVARDLMVFFGGEAFAVSATVFMVMAPLLPLRFLNNGFAMTLSTLDRQRDRTVGVALAAVLNLGANLVAIPAFGALGAAGTTLATEVALALWFRWHIRPLVAPLGLPSTLARVGIPAAAMLAVLQLLPPLPVLVVIAVGVVVYAAVGWGTGAWRPQDLRQLRRV